MPTLAVDNWAEVINIASAILVLSGAVSFGWFLRRTVTRVVTDVVRELLAPLGDRLTDLESGHKLHEHRISRLERDNEIIGGGPGSFK